MTEELDTCEESEPEQQANGLIHEGTMLHQGIPLRRGKPELGSWVRGETKGHAMEGA